MTTLKIGVDWDNQYQVEVPMTVGFISSFLTSVTFDLYRCLLPLYGVLVLYLQIHVS